MWSFGFVRIMFGCFLHFCAGPLWQVSCLAGWLLGFVDCCGRFFGFNRELINSGLVLEFHCLFVALN